MSSLPKSFLLALFLMPSLARIDAASPAAPPAPRTFSVTDFGAVGGDRLDDAASIQRAVDSANLVRGVVFFPPGTYRIAATIHVTKGDFFGCRLEGANAEGVRIISGMNGTDPVFSFRGGSGRFSNVGMKNMTLAADSGLAGQGTGIYIDGQGFGIFENVRIFRLANGIWLHNRSPGSFSELNQFTRMQIDFCKNGIRMEQGKGTDSFNGNSFTEVFLNVGKGQTGFNHVSGYYYNGRFRLSMWAHDNSSVFVNADGNAEHNVGDITYESGNQVNSRFGRGRLTGQGRFWFNGYLRGIGPLSDETDKAGGDSCQKVFACDNYWKSSRYGGSGFAAGPLRAPMDSYNGPLGFFQSLRKPNVESVLLNTYGGSSEENGLYLGTSAYRCGEEKGRLGLFLGGDGTRIRTYAEEPLKIEARAVAVPGGKLTVGSWEIPREALQVTGNVEVQGGIRSAEGFWTEAGRAAQGKVEPVTGTLDKLMRLRPVKYLPEKEAEERVGLAAEEVERQFPELVLSDGERKFVDYARLAPLLLAALREQQEMIAVQKRRLDSLSGLRSGSLK